jgi:hypothetical protein
MNKKDIKQLAEDYFFRGKKITAEERNILKESKYSRVLRNDTPVFDSMFENVVTSMEEEKDEAPYRPFKAAKKPYSHFHTGIQRKAVKDLGDEIDDALDLDITNFSPSKFREVDVNVLKTLIKNYADKHVFDKVTKQFILDIANDKTQDPIKILYRIYSVK